jgi:hypothetical protein
MTPPPVPVTVLAAYPLSISSWPARTGHTDVVTVGRVTMERIDPHGFAGPLGHGDGEGAWSAAGTSAAAATLSIVLKTTNAATNNRTR